MSEMLKDYNHPGPRQLSHAALILPGKPFIKIQENLNKMSATIESLKLWVSQAIADGQINKKIVEHDN